MNGSSPHYEGIAGFIHRIKSRVIPRINDVHEKLFGLQAEDYLPPEEKEIIEDIWLKLASRRARLSSCAEALESLPPDDAELAAEILAKFNSSNVPDHRIDLCLLLRISARATDAEILDACRIVLKNNPRGSRSKGEKPPNNPKSRR